MLNINRLAALVAASVIILGSAGCQSTTAETQDTSISGGSGSTEAAAAAATAESADATESAVQVADVTDPEQRGRGRGKGKGKKKKGDGLICKRERVTGSHMSQRVCRTAEEIEERREADQRTINDSLSTPINTGS